MYAQEATGCYSQTSRGGMDEGFDFDGDRRDGTVHPCIRSRKQSGPQPQATAADLRILNPQFTQRPHFGVDTTGTVNPSDKGEDDFFSGHSLSVLFLLIFLFLTVF